MSSPERAVSLSIALLIFGAAACGGAAHDAARVQPPAPASATPAPVASAAPDPLGLAPSVTLTPPFQPPAPTVYLTANGMTVWLLERHAFPVVAVTVVIPTGSSSDPKGEPGLADQSARMLTEGAGKRGSLEFARAVDDLGARLDVGVSLTRVTFISEW